MNARWSLPLCRLFGIQVELHVTFLAFLLYACLIGFQASGWAGIGWSLAIVCGGFSSVIAHELGHALTARQYGIATNRILLLPIGGIAQLAAMPREPRRELLVTIAGPAVNFALAALLCCLLYLGNVAFTPTALLHEFVYFDYSIAGWFRLMLAYNLLMGLFNGLPLFPMDGGRILRSLLGLKYPYVAATRIAVWVSRPLTILAILGALLTEHWLLVALFAFILFAGEMEWQGTRRHSRYGDVPLGDLTARRLRRVQAKMTLREALPICLFEQPPELIVQGSDRIIGVLRPEDVLSWARQRPLETPLEDFVPEPTRLQARWPLGTVIKQVEAWQANRILIYEGDQFLGIFRSDQIDRLLEWRRQHSLAYAADYHYRTGTPPPFPLPADIPSLASGPSQSQKPVG